MKPRDERFRILAGLAFAFGHEVLALGYARPLRASSAKPAPDFDPGREPLSSSSAPPPPTTGEG